MCELIRMTKKPCIAFKVLAAGRAIGSPERVREELAFALRSIKPTDAILVGMYQQFGDQIGKNAALDAAVDAFATGFSTLHSDAYGLEAFQKYGHALKALGECLDDPVRGQTPETMCAIYLIMVVQVSNFSGHRRCPHTLYIPRDHLLTRFSGLDWSARCSQFS